MMRYNLLFIDVGYFDKYPTYAHMINVSTGDHVNTKTLKGNMKDQVDDLIEVISRDMPDKIIFDRSGYGRYFYEVFMKELENRSVEFKIDAFGLIMYDWREYGGNF